MPSVWSWYQSVDSRWSFGYWKTASPGPHMALKLEDDAEALLARFSAKGISDIIDPFRLNVGATHYGLHS